MKEIITFEDFEQEKEKHNESVKWNTPFIEKFAVHEKFLLDLKKKIEIENAILDLIDYNFEGKEIFENALTLAKVEDVMSEVVKDFPDLEKKYPTQERIDQVRNERIEACNQLNAQKETVFEDLKKEFINSINFYMSEGFWASESGAVSYLNHLEKNNIGDISLTIIPLIKAGSKEEFEGMLSKMDNIDQIRIGDDILRQMMINNDLYEARNILGHASLSIPQYINDFNKSSTSNAYIFFMTNNQPSQLIVTHFDKFDRLLPENILEETKENAARYAIGGMLNAAADYAINGMDYESKIYFPLIKAFNKDNICDKFIKEECKRLSKMNGVKETEFYKELIETFKETPKKKMKIN